VGEERRVRRSSNAVEKRRRVTVEEVERLMVEGRENQNSETSRETGNVCVF